MIYQLPLPGMESRLPPPSWVYFGSRAGLIKIGTSEDPRRRARELGIVLLRVAPGGVEDERRLHRRFARFRVDREWFLPAPEVLAYAGEAAAA